MNYSAYSSPAEIKRLCEILRKYLRLPFTNSSVPGSILEGALAYVRNGNVLNTYDFVDVIHPKANIGWQVKSTRAATPVTWKRAKIPNADRLIRKSQSGSEGCQELGDAILAFCNNHAMASMKLYDLRAIAYSRLIVHEDGTATYFERLLCTDSKPEIFRPQHFQWSWSKPKKVSRKEQLQAFHGLHVPSGKKWWAWHGLGENQLHFGGERTWWPANGDSHTAKFYLPDATDKLDIKRFLSLLDPAS